MKNLDLRHVGTILGQPLYVDLSSVRNEDQRNKKETMIGDLLYKLISGHTQEPKPKYQQVGRIFDSEIRTFDPDDVLTDMVEAQEGAVFVLGTRQIHTEGTPQDDNEVEITFAQIKKVRSK